MDFITDKKYPVIKDYSAQNNKRADNSKYCKNQYITCKIKNNSNDSFCKSPEIQSDVVNYIPTIQVEHLKRILESFSNEQSIQIPQYAKSVNNKIRPKVPLMVAYNSAKRATNDPELQQALMDFAQQEAVIIRTKSDATPIMREQFEHIKDKENAIVLDINPQLNNGMQKSNTLISGWYAEANDIPQKNLVTLRRDELRTKALRPSEIHPDWAQGSSIAKQIERQSNKVDTISMDKAREIIDGAKGLTSDEILEKYSIPELASAYKTINYNVIAPQKKQGYIGALVAQLDEVTKGKDEVSVIIPDDCSLSGSSMLCDSVRILDKFIKNNPTKKVHVVFSPLILGDIAKERFETFMDKDTPLNNMYLRQVSAIKTDGTEASPGIVAAFGRVKNSDNLTFEVTPNNLRATHFTDTEYFKDLKDQELKSKLTYILQGGLDNDSAQFGGFGSCGTMVITPTEEFEIDGKTYAGKIPTNSVGYMELLGHQSGVLNDECDSKGKGLFTKGTGKGYSRYCEWGGLANPEKAEDRIPVTVASDGSISVKKVA